MPAWADVWVEDAFEQDRLERKALFFIPSAFEKLDRLDLTQTALYTQASALKSQPRRRGTNQLPSDEEAAKYGVAGRAAIREVMRCFPVTYRSARGFINVANMALAALEAGSKLKSSDIVACIFRLKDAPDVVEALGLASSDIAKACGIRAEIVESARLRYRITFNHAISIWKYLLSVKHEKKITDPKANALNDDPREFIKTDVQTRHPLAVRPSSEERAEASVYGRRDLTPAPRMGHPWAIER